MAKNNGTDQAHQNGNGGPQAPEGWTKLKTDRRVYSADRGKGGIVQGLMLGVLDMPPANGKPWQAIVVRVTAPVGCKDRDDKPAMAQPGDEILVPLNHQLRQHLARAAVHPSVMFEVWIRPASTVKTQAGTMIVWDLHVNPQAVRREGSDRLLAAMAAAPALPPAGGAGQGSDAADDTPF